MRDGINSDAGSVTKLITDGGSVAEAEVIRVGSSVELLTSVDGGVRSVTLIDNSRDVDFKGYSNGHITLTNGDSDYIIVNSCRMIQFTSDEMVTVTLTLEDMSTVTLPLTRRFSYESNAAFRVSVSYPVDTDNPLAATGIQFISTME